MSEVRNKEAHQAAFLAAFRTCYSIKQAAAAAKINPSTHKYWMKHDPEYAKVFTEARENAVDALEDEAYRRAVDGMERKKFHNGEPIIDPVTGEQYVEREYSDKLLELLLKANFPAKYRERMDLKHEGEVGVTVKRIILTDDSAKPANH